MMIKTKFKSSKKDIPAYGVPEGLCLEWTELHAELSLLDFAFHHSEQLHFLQKWRF